MKVVTNKLDEKKHLHADAPYAPSPREFVLSRELTSSRIQKGKAYLLNRNTFKICIINKDL